MPRAAWGMAIAHSALGIFVIGVTASSAWKIEMIQLMKPGEIILVDDYKITLGTSNIKGPNYSGIQGQFEVNVGGDVITMLKPEKRRYKAERSETTEAAILTTLKGDLYGVLGEESGVGAWSTVSI